MLLGSSSSCERDRWFDSCESGQSTTPAGVGILKELEMPLDMSDASSLDEPLPNSEIGMLNCSAFAMSRSSALSSSGSRANESTEEARDDGRGTGL